MFRTHLQWMRLPLKKIQTNQKQQTNQTKNTHTTMVDETKKKKRKKYSRRKVISILGTVVHVVKLET